MENEDCRYESNEGYEKSKEISYNFDKDFYKGIGGELRFKAEGLFKKAKEKGISIEEINITTLKENSVEFPGIGYAELPTYVVKVKGRHVESDQVIIDGKQIDYYNRYQKYVAQKIENNNMLKDDKGRVIKENGKSKVKNDIEFALSDWERFQIGKCLVEDKEYGMEKAITGACDRVIRKLMGENDWLYPKEAKLLDEEFKDVQESILKEEPLRQFLSEPVKKATDRQINYLKSRIKNFGLNPESDEVMREILSEMGIKESIFNISVSEMSKLIDGVQSILPKIKEKAGAKNMPSGNREENIKQ